nr:integrase arm-type DNA-binding domain-containing protein [Acidobacteriota bacterium]
MATPARRKLLQTDRDIATHRPEVDRYTVRDSKVKGLELLVQSSGAKIWSMRYRVAGQQRRLRLGEYPGIGLAEARTRARKALVTVDDGQDPQREREVARLATERQQRASIDHLCEDYIARHAKPKKRSWREDQRIIDNEILPHWKGRPVSTITRRDVRELVEAIADRGAPT